MNGEINEIEADKDSGQNKEQKRLRVEAQESDAGQGISSRKTTGRRTTPMPSWKGKLRDTIQVEVSMLIRLIVLGSSIVIALNMPASYRRNFMRVNLMVSFN